MAKLKTVMVYANPYLALDHEGRIAGACALDPEHNGGRMLYVGAAYHLELTKVTQVFDEGDPRGTHLQDTVHAFSGEATEIPYSTFHQDRIRDGELFVAGPDGAPPWLQLAAARNRAIDDWHAHWGEDPDASKWAELFPLDDQVKAVAEALAAKAKVEAAKAKADAAAAAKDAAAKAEAAQKKAAEARNASHAEVLKALGETAAAPDQPPIVPTETPVPGEASSATESPMTGKSRNGGTK